MPQPGRVRPPLTRSMVVSDRADWTGGRAGDEGMSAHEHAVGGARGDAQQDERVRGGIELIRDGVAPTAVADDRVHPR